MRGSFKIIADWVIPPKFQKALSSSIYPYIHQQKLSAEDRQIITQNLKFKNCHQGKRCFILATGPSIKRQDLLPLKNEICFATSSFYLHPDFHHISPRYYCVPGFCSNSTEIFWDDWMDALIECTSSQPTTFFFSLSDKERCTRTGRFSNREIHFLDFFGSFEEPSVKYIDLTRPVPSPQSVPVMALEIALFMGFSEIYLLGCDHDWIFHMYESRHFYNENLSVMHSHKIDEWMNNTLEINFISYLALWKQYGQIKNIAMNRNTAIFNATNGGLLDVFPRTEFEKLFNP